MFKPFCRNRTRRPALEMLEGRILLSDVISASSTTGVVTIAGSSSATAPSNFTVTWHATSNAGVERYIVADNSVSLGTNPWTTAFPFTVTTSAGGIAFAQNPSDARQIQIIGLDTAFNNGLSTAALTINNGTGGGATINVQSSGPGLPINVHDGSPGTIQNVTVGASGQSGLQFVQGPVNVTDAGGAAGVGATNLTIDDTGDTATNSGITLTQTGFNTQVGTNPNLTINYTLAALTGLTFDSSGANGGGNMVTINDQPIANPSAGLNVPVAVNDNSGKDMIVVNGTDAHTSLAINDAAPGNILGQPESVTIGSTGVFGGPNPSGLQSIQGPVTVTDQNGGLTALTLDDTADPAPNAGISLTGSVLSTTLTPQNQPNVNVSVTYQRQSAAASSTGLVGLTFNTSSANSVGSLVTINDQGIPGPGVSVPVTINDDSNLDQIGVTGTDGFSTLTINGLTGNKVNLGSGPGTPASQADVLQNLNGNITVAGPSGAIALGVYDTADGAPVTTAITATGITFTTGTASTGLTSRISYSTPAFPAPLSSLSIIGGSGGNTFNVTGLPGLPVGTPTSLTLGSNTAATTANTANVVGTALTNAGLSVVGATASDVLNLDASATPGVTVAPVSTSPPSVGFSSPATNGGLLAQVGTVNIKGTPAPASPNVSITATQGVPAANQDVADFNVPVLPASAVSLQGSVPVAINWGDGSAATPGAVAADMNTPGLFHVTGTHTFSTATAANTPNQVVATVTGPLSFNLSGVTINELPASFSLPPAAATVAASGGGTTPTGPNFVKGALTPASNTGNSSTGLVTNDTTPQFSGTTNPGATVTLFVQGLKSYTTPTPVGTAVADSSGNWTITAFALPADSYQFTIQSVDTNGSMATAALTTAAKPLVIDLAGPVIESATLNAKTKQILVVFQDSAGLNVSSLANPAAYAIAGKGVGRITTLNVSGSGTVVSVALKFATGRGFARKLTFLVRSANVTDAAGNHLNGTFLNRFPTGNGGSGGNFLVTLPVKIKPVKKPGGRVVVIVHP